MKIAFLGLGLMGAPMAGRIAAAGFAPHIWSRSGDKTHEAARWGAVACSTPARAVVDADLIFTCLTDADAMDDLLFGPCRTADAFGPDALLVDFSSMAVDATRSLAARLRAARGVAWLDCPVSGGVAGAEAGTLSVFAGGEIGDLERARPQLEVVATRITHIGPLGAGQAAKLCNQLIVSANLLAIAEAIVLGQELGVDVATLPEALAGGFADSRPLQFFGPRMAAAIDPGPQVSKLGTMAKDVATIAAAAAAADLALPLLDHVAARYERALDSGLALLDLPALVNLYRAGGEARDI